MASLEDLTPEARDELAALARQLAENPNTRKDFLKLTKQVNPNLPVPELEIEERTERVLTKAQERVEQLENKLRERDAVGELEKRRLLLLKKGKIKSEEEIEQVEKVMLEKGITDHETAADYWNWMNQAAQPTKSGYNPNVLDKNTKSVLSQYWKNPTTAAREQAAKALEEIRKNPRPVGF
jgi:hypothetical protein